MEKAERFQNKKITQWLHHLGCREPTFKSLFCLKHKKLEPILFTSEVNIQIPSLHDPLVALLCWILLTCNSKGTSLLCHLSDDVLCSHCGLTLTEKFLLKGERLSNIRLKHPPWITPSSKIDHASLKTSVLRHVMPWTSCNLLPLKIKSCFMLVSVEISFAVVRQISGSSDSRRELIKQKFIGIIWAQSRTNTFPSTVWIKIWIISELLSIPEGIYSANS